MPALIQLSTFLLAACLCQADPDPRGWLTINGGAGATNNRTVTLRIRPTIGGKAVDTVGLEMSFSCDGALWERWRTYTPTATFELSKGDGAKTVHAKFRDKTGRETKPIFASIALDTAPPVPKAACPGSWDGNRVLLMSDVPDAVSMMIADGAWEPYSSPRIVTSPAPKLSIRYRDEAGNVSDRIPLDVPAARSPITAGVLEIAGLKEREGQRFVSVWITASAITEMELSLDDEVHYRRGPFLSMADLRWPPSTGAHRVTARFWDAAGNAYDATLALQEQSVPRHPLNSWPYPTRPRIVAALSTGFWILPASFDAVTAAGSRELDGGALWTFQARAALELMAPFSIGLTGEYATASKATITSVGAEVTWRCHRGPIGPVDGDIHIVGGVFHSRFDVSDSDFGDFDPGIGFRLGARATSELRPNLRLELGLEYRHVTYEWSEDLVSGDSEIAGSGVVGTVGVSYGF